MTNQSSLYLTDADIAWAESRVFPSQPSATPATTPVQLAPTRAQLASAMQVLGPRDQAFAQSLLDAWSRYGSLTPRQMPYAQQLIDRATKPEATSAKPAVSVGNFAAVVALFNRASAKLKFPKVRLLLGDTPIILSLAGARSSAPGTINVAGEGTYPNRAWYGRVTASGDWQPARNVSPETLSALASLLTQFGADPDSTAAAYGRQTGSCCFCQRELTDARSVAAGYGPVCAGHYGLSAQWEAAADSTSLQGTLGGVIE